MNLSNEAAGVISAVTKTIVGWAKTEVDALKLRVEQTERKLADIGDPTAAIEALGTEVGGLRESNESVRQVIEDADFSGSQKGTSIDDEAVKTIKRQLTRHAEHLARLQDRILKLEHKG